MKKRNILILLLIFLLIIGAMSYIFILENDVNKINNIANNNSTDFQLNKSIEKNMSLNNLNDSNNENGTIDENLSNTYNNPSSDSNYQYNTNKYNDKKDSNNYDEAMEAKRGVEKFVLNKNEIAGYPVYKHPRLNAWLVPIFDKKTKHFLGSVYIYKGGQAFVLGPSSYSNYKDVISGKTVHKSNSNKHVGSDKSNKLSKSKTIAVGKSNANTSIDSDLVNDRVYNVNPDTSNILSLENEEIITDSDSTDNLTC